MGLSYVEVARSVFGTKRAVLTTVTFDSSYPTGGESIVPADVGLASIDAIFVADGSRTIQYDKANAKLMAFGSGTRTVTMDAHSHVAGAITSPSHLHVENEAGSYTQSVNTAGTVATATAADTATTVATGTVSGLAGAVLAEVANATNLATTSAILLILGN